MKIAMVRIDERLIHGQITMGWVRTTSANLIVVANDTVANDSFRKKLMKMAAPPGANVEIHSIDETSDMIAKEGWPNNSILLLVHDPVDMLRLVEKGLSVKKVNIGGVRSPEATIKLTKEVSATEKEMEAWLKLDELGIRLEEQFVPNSGITVINDLLKNYKK
jgi:mannose/fructose/N-acetylgalactosamine-specific phosphotransferase system component IIB